MAKLTIEVDLDCYRDSYDNTVFLGSAQKDINDALNQLSIGTGTVLVAVAVKHYGKSIGRVSVDMEA